MVILIAQTSQAVVGSIDPWTAAVWGAIGGGITFLLTVLELIQNPPPSYSLSFIAGNFIAALIRAVLGGITAYLFAASNQVSGLFGACGIGMAAPEILRRVKEAFTTKPLPGDPRTPAPDGTATPQPAAHSSMNG
jgi:hypothetical protein